MIRYCSKSLSILTLAVLAAGGMPVQGDEKESLPSLSVGSRAPKINIEHWVSNGNGKFKPVEEFEPGKIYVVEFWATWCGPCVASMPHLAELQERWGGKNVQVISISDEDLETVEAFLKKPFRGSRSASTEAEAKGESRAEKKTYATLTSAYCLTTDPDRSVSIDYMEAAGQDGIPTSFLVGPEGIIEWIGHPMELDEPVEQVVNGTWDREAFRMTFAIESAMQSSDFETALKLITECRKSSAKKPELEEKLQRMEVAARANLALVMIQDGKVEDGLKKLDEVAAIATADQKIQIVSTKFQMLINSELYAETEKALQDLGADKAADPELLNQVTWMIYETAKDDDDIPKSVVKSATGVAEIAMKAQPKNGMIVDTVAHLQHLQGNLDLAIELAEKAIASPGNASEEMIDEMKEYLKSLQREKSRGKAKK